MAPATPHISSTSPRLQARHSRLGGKETVESHKADRRTDVTTQTIDYQRISHETFLQDVASQALLTTPDDIPGRTLRSFSGTLPPDARGPLAEKDLLRWLAAMLRRGTAPATRRRYFGALHNIWLKSTKNTGCDDTTAQSPAPEATPIVDSHEENDPFTRLKESDLYSRFQNAQGGWAEPTLKQLDTLGGLLQSLPDTTGERRQATALLLLMLISADFSPLHATMRRFDDPELNDGDLRWEELTALMREDPRQQYVLRLGQNAKRAPQLSREAEEMLRRLLADTRLAYPGEAPSDSVKHLWTAAALHSGIPAADVAAITSPADGKPRDPESRYAWLDLLPNPYGSENLCLTERHNKPTTDTPSSTDDGIAPRPCGIPASRRRAILLAVAERLHPTRQAWYALRLRKGTDPDGLKDATKERLGEAVANSLTWYYPTLRRATRIEGKKGVHFIEEPLTPGILFLRIRPGDLPKMMRQIGDLAWCYRTVNAPGATYSVIPDDEMLRFQTLARQFTPDMRPTLHPADDATSPRPDFELGQQVRITAGLMAGYTGTIVTLPTEAPDATEDPAAATEADPTTAAPLRQLEIRLTADTFLRWVIAIPDTDIVPLEEQDA